MNELALTKGLIARIGETRASFLELERRATTLDDVELAGRVACARLALLDVRDRLEQLEREFFDEYEVAAA